MTLGSTACPAITPKEIHPTDRVFKLLQAQDGFIFSESRYPAYIAAWGTGKSFALIQRAMILSEESPKNLGVIFRREYTDLRDSTCKDFERYTGLKINSERSVKLKNGSEILFRHLEEMQGTVQNLNLGWFAIEQSDELETDEIFNVLRGRLRRDGVKRRSGFVVGNTNGHDWQHKLWKIASDKDYALYESTSFDASKYLPPDTIEDWKKLEQSSPKIYRRFVLNSWEESDTNDVIINPEWVRAAVNRRLVVNPPFRRVISCDVARFGDDKTVAYAIENGKVLDLVSWEKKDTMETVGRLMVFAKKCGEVESFAIDEIGVGGGVVDRLRELGKHVIPVNGSNREAGAGYYNRRAQIYAHGADMLREGMVQLTPGDLNGQEELSWARYKTIKSSGDFQVEAKEDIKKRYGRSPDYADALLNGLWAMAQAKPYHKPDKYERARVQTNTFVSPVGALG